MATTRSKYMPLDLVNQVLIRLPAHSIVKCLCINKQWYTLITSDEFIAAHLSRNLNSSMSNVLIGRQNIIPRRRYFELYRDDENLCLLQTVPPPLNSKKRSREHLQVIGTIHGLVCLSMYGCNVNHFIWNPSIRKYLAIPELDNSCYYSQRSLSNMMGFGFDSIRNDYKVVRMLIDKYHRCLCVRVYSLKGRAWRGATEGPGYSLRRWSSSCFANGSVHWIVERNYIDAFDRTSSHFILSFDMHNDDFGRIELPQGLISRNLGISETNGLLTIFDHIVVVRSCGTYTGCDIWVQKEWMKDLWTKLYNIEFENTFLHRVFKLKEDGENLIAIGRQGELALYNPTTKEIKALGTQAISYHFYAGVYTDSLLLLNTW